MNPILKDYFIEFTSNDDLFTYLGKFYLRHNSIYTWNHCIKVADEARQIAHKYDLDIRIAEQAGWLHDIGTVVPNEQKINLCLNLGITVKEEEHKFPYILHQKLSKIMTSDVFGINNSELLDAIECHTTLRANCSIVDKVLFVADKLSWDQGDSISYLTEMRKKLDDSLDDAARVYLDHVWKNREHMKIVHPWLIQARSDLFGQGMFLV